MIRYFFALKKKLLGIQHPNLAIMSEEVANLVKRGKFCILVNFVIVYGIVKMLYHYFFIIVEKK